MKQIDGQISIFDFLKPKTGELRGLLDDPYCPTCGNGLNDYVNQCDHCGQSISWEHWKDKLTNDTNDFTECIFKGGPCNHKNLRPVAREIGMNCLHNCCNSCKELCGARCNNCKRGG